MTQVKSAQESSAQIAWKSRGRRRTLAERRADFEAQMRAAANMGLTDLNQVRERMKALRSRTGLKQHEVAQRIDVPYRTFQSWENGEVETERSNYEKVAKLYGVTANYILFGQDEEPPLPKPDTAGVNQRLADLEHVVGDLVAELRADRAVQRAKDARQEKQRSRPQRQAERPAKRRKAEGG